ncbi:uncharacterized protein F5147DRAFT_720308 [Suillus discolor]|uniref:Uncharacterized protein n=1 Tax=Suillus discolor TaxID=1912936 RepID=A0A9P7EW31_9AGAM|nr:uncharacterized protein F5147DRAFT_720308 [Suillus discolor]KAG2094054.1 hypothetical protein F5147DRAFT_720308 [Suillus discolor]
MITMKLFQVIYIIFLTASSAAASATRAMAALPPQITCAFPCVSSKESLDCMLGTSPLFTQDGCWQCCGKIG